MILDNKEVTTSSILQVDENGAKLFTCETLHAQRDTIFLFEIRADLSGHASYEYRCIFYASNILDHLHDSDKHLIDQNPMIEMDVQRANVLAGFISNRS